MTDTRIALVTGANRGIGRAIAQGLARRGFHVVVGSRDLAKAAPIVAEIVAAGGRAEALALDIVDHAGIAAAARELAARHGRLDVLINNAGIMVGMADTILDAAQADIERSMATNAYGALAVTKAMLPLLRESKAGRIVNISSTVGSIADTVDPSSYYAGFETASYRLSKAALNAITGLLAKALRDSHILVNAMCPGWVRTDMGGADALRSPEQGAETALWLATLPADGPTGGFFGERQAIPW